MADCLQALFQMLVEGQMIEAQELLQKKMEAGVPADLLLNKGLIAAMQRTGALHGAGEISTTQLLRTLEAVEACMKLLGPYLLG